MTNPKIHLKIGIMEGLHKIEFKWQKWQMDEIAVELSRDKNIVPFKSLL